jgi:hypothetical protein
MMDGGRVRRSAGDLHACSGARLLSDLRRSKGGNRTKPSGPAGVRNAPEELKATTAESIRLQGKQQRST